MVLQDSLGLPGPLQTCIHIPKYLNRRAFVLPQPGFSRPLAHGDTNSLIMLTYETSPELRDMANAAVLAQFSTQFPARVVLTVGGCESGWFKSVTGSFNYWGITRNPEQGPAKMCPTHEDIKPGQLSTFRSDEQATAVQAKDLGGGKFRYTMSRWFASYASLEESVASYTEFFTKSPHRYQPAWQQFLADHDEEALLKHICEAGYATGNAEGVELAILHQPNIAHAVDMARKAASV